jgi:hypothetical protein
LCLVTDVADRPDEPVHATKACGGNLLEARLRRCRWVTVRELVPTSQARLYPPLCAAAEAMSAGRGDMHIRVIWVLPGGGDGAPASLVPGLGV